MDSVEYPIEERNGMRIRLGSWSHRKETGEVLSTKTRIEVLYLYRGRCFVCGIEEWRYKRRLNMHRVHQGRDGGCYTVENTVPVCGRCHLSIEGMDWEQITPLRHPDTVEVTA